MGVFNQIKMTKQVMEQTKKETDELKKVWDHLIEVINQALISEKYNYELLKKLCEKQAIEIPEHIKKHFIIEENGK